MINLLPPELKEAYRYAHHNVQLVRWVAAFIVSIVGLAVISTAGLIYVHQTTESYITEIATKQRSLKQQQLAGTQAQVRDITSSLKLAVKVLSKEVLFSKLLGQLAAITPNNVVLTDLNIAQVQGGVNITAMTSDYAAATQLQVNLADPGNQLFSKADIVSITCIPQSSGGRYPCSVTIRALFANHNPYLFINDGGV